MEGQEQVAPRCRIGMVRPTPAGKACKEFMQWLSDRCRPTVESPPDWYAKRFEEVR